MLSESGQRCNMFDVQKASEVVNSFEDIGEEGTWAECIKTIIYNTTGNHNIHCAPDEIIGPLYTKNGDTYVKTFGGMKKVK